MQEGKVYSRREVNGDRQLQDVQVGVDPQSREARMRGRMGFVAVIQALEQER